MAQSQLIVDCKYGLNDTYHVEATHSLDNVLGIQLLHSGFHNITSTGPQSSTSERFHTYEMNLVLNNEDNSRLHLCTHSDWKWMRDVGVKLTQYIGKPLIDQL